MAIDPYKIFDDGCYDTCSVWNVLSSRNYIKPASPRGAFLHHTDGVYECLYSLAHPWHPKKWIDARFKKARADGAFPFKNVILKTWQN